MELDRAATCEGVMDGESGELTEGEGAIGAGSPVFVLCDDLPWLLSMSICSSLIKVMEAAHLDNPRSFLVLTDTGLMAAFVT